jgi:iron(III) transport system substrate-binding protein
MKTPVRSGLAALAAIAAITSFAGAAAANGEVNLYSYRQEFLIRPLLDAFTQDTGVKVNVQYVKGGILKRMQEEGEDSAVDAVLTADIATLRQHVEADTFQPVQSDVLTANVPVQYRHPDGEWFGLTVRARVIVHSKDRVKAGEITRYEDLADPKWKGRICTRSSGHVYMKSLLASIIAAKGEEGAQGWANGVKANLARKPQGNDRAQVKAIWQGECDVALINTYYLGKMRHNESEPVQKEWAASIGIVFPNQGDRGTLRRQQLRIPGQAGCSVGCGGRVVGQVQGRRHRSVAHRRTRAAGDHHLRPRRLPVGRFPNVRAGSVSGSAGVPPPPQPLPRPGGRGAWWCDPAKQPLSLERGRGWGAG